VPTKKGWISLYIEAIDNTPIKHFLYAWGDCVEKKYYDNIEVYIMNHIPGILYTMNRIVVEKVGAFDYRMKRYGFEHVDWTMRAQMAGYLGTEGWKFPHLKVVEDYFTVLSELNTLYKEGLNAGHLVEYSAFNQNILDKHVKENIIYIPFEEQYLDIVRIK
jgi:hypothetical protein